MNIQTTLFAPPENDDAGGPRYSRNIEVPVYEPRHDKPVIHELSDKRKTSKLLAEIEAADLDDAEKSFLRDAATRHTVFHYERIADYYSHATPEMQRLMERSALVIIDFNSAIEGGFVQLCDEIRRQFFEEHVDHAQAAE